MKHLFVMLTLAAAVIALSATARGQSPGTARITVTSVPVGATLVVDGNYVGLTPIRDQKLQPGRHIVVLKLHGYIPTVDTVLVESAADFARQYELRLASTLSVTSTPAGGAVYIDNVFRGVTPLVIEELRPGKAVVAVSQRYFFTSLDTVELPPAAVAKLSVTLHPRPATLSVEVPGPGIELYLNDRLVGTSSLQDTSVAAGDLTIGARQVSTGTLVSTTTTLLPSASARYAVRFDVASSDPFFSSLLLPGLGQRRAGAGTLGTCIEIGFGAALAVAVGGQIKGAISYNDYSDSHSRYDQATTKADALALHNTAQEQYNSAKSAYRIRDIGLWSALAVYVLSAADALFIHNREDQIELLPDLPNEHSLAQPIPALRLEVRL